MPRDKTAEVEKMPIASAWGKRSGKRNRSRLQRKLQNVGPAQTSQLGPTLGQELAFCVCLAHAVLNKEAG